MSRDNVFCVYILASQWPGWWTRSGQVAKERQNTLSYDLHTFHWQQPWSCLPWATSRLTTLCLPGNGPSATDDSWPEHGCSEPVEITLKIFLGTSTGSHTSTASTDLGMELTIQDCSIHSEVLKWECGVRHRTCLAVHLSLVFK